MPRNMSFYHTQSQVRDKSKTVTRRNGWEMLLPGERFWAVVKARGLKPGERVEKICLLECVSNRRERLDLIACYPVGETAREGFPDMTPKEFVQFFCQEMKCTPRKQIQRIEFRYVDEAEAAQEAAQPKKKVGRAPSRPIHRTAHRRHVAGARS